MIRFFCSAQKGEEMTRTELCQARYIEAEIAMWKKRLAESDSQSYAKAQPTYVISGRSKNSISSSVEARGTNAADIDGIIEGLLAEAQIAKKKIIVFISTIEDSLIRQIVYNYCVEGKSWKETAGAIGGRNTADSVRKQFERAFPEK